MQKLKWEKPSYYARVSGAWSTHYSDLNNQWTLYRGERCLDWFSTLGELKRRVDKFVAKHGDAASTAPWERL